MTAYYNENDPVAAAWLGELIKEGLICPGDVDQRSIEEIEPSELERYDQCHFFAGIGVWSWALRNAGWADDARVWSGSCPCQSFSQSGDRGGFDDKRHLWPAWFRLIEKCRPDVIFGEQVASKDGLAWFDLVSSDLEGAGYAVGAADLCAAGLGAPHIRQRLFFVGQSDRTRSQPGNGTGATVGHRNPVVSTNGAGRMENTEHDGCEAGSASIAGLASGAALAKQRSGACNVGISESERYTVDLAGSVGSQEPAESPNFTNGFWRAAEWIYCRDEKYRPVEPGTFPLVTGAPARVGRLRGYGNSIVAPCAQAFIEAWLEGNQ